MCFSAQETQVIFSRLFVDVRRVCHKTQANVHECVLFITFQGRPGVMGPQGEPGLQGYTVSFMHTNICTYECLQNHTHICSFESEPLNYRFCVCLNKGVFRYFFVYVDQPDMIID